MEKQLTGKRPIFWINSALLLLTLLVYYHLAALVILSRPEEFGFLGSIPYGPVFVILFGVLFTVVSDMNTELPDPNVGWQRDMRLFLLKVMGPKLNTLSITIWCIAALLVCLQLHYWCAAVPVRVNGGQLQAIVKSGASVSAEQGDGTSKKVTDDLMEGNFFLSLNWGKGGTFVIEDAYKLRPPVRKKYEFAELCRHYVLGTRLALKWEEPIKILEPPMVRFRVIQPQSPDGFLDEIVSASNEQAANNEILLTRLGIEGVGAHISDFVKAYVNAGKSTARMQFERRDYEIRSGDEPGVDLLVVEHIRVVPETLTTEEQEHAATYSANFVDTGDEANMVGLTDMFTHKGSMWKNNALLHIVGVLKAKNFLGRSNGCETYRRVGTLLERLMGAVDWISESSASDLLETLQEYYGNWSEFGPKDIRPFVRCMLTLLKTGKRDPFLTNFLAALPDRMAHPRTSDNDVRADVVEAISGPLFNLIDNQDDVANSIQTLKRIGEKASGTVRLQLKEFVKQAAELELWATNTEFAGLVDLCKQWQDRYN